MLLEKIEAEIIQDAVQATLRNPNYSWLSFQRILEDFFTDEHLLGKTILDLGPGQYDFCELARDRGAKCWGVDRDPAVVRLGQYKGFDIREAELKTISTDLFGFLFDGLFCRASINAFWFSKDLDKLYEHTQKIASLVRDDGWGFIIPANVASASLNLTDDRKEEILQVQQMAFLEKGFQIHKIPDKKAMFYNIVFGKQNTVVFCKDIQVRLR